MIEATSVALPTTLDAIISAVERRDLALLMTMTVDSSHLTRSMVCQWLDDGVSLEDGNVSFEHIHQEKLTLLELLERLKDQGISDYIYAQLSADIDRQVVAIKQSRTLGTFSSFTTYAEAIRQKLSEKFILALRCHQSPKVLRRSVSATDIHSILADFKARIANYTRQCLNANDKQQHLADMLSAFINERERGLGSFFEQIKIRRQAATWSYPEKSIFDIFSQMARFNQSLSVLEYPSRPSHANARQVRK